VDEFARIKATPVVSKGYRFVAIAPHARVISVVSGAPPELNPLHLKRVAWGKSQEVIPESVILKEVSRENLVRVNHDEMCPTY
jgi:hypothetical protein